MTTENDPLKAPQTGTARAPRFTAAEKAAEAAREVDMRLRVYGRSRTPSRDTISALQLRRVEIMEEILEEYKALAEKERLL